uniref:Uncharacterized protein n=2 Tax=Tetranychus urticae TaxID=32264 RepID=T1KIR7_TETUR
MCSETWGSYMKNTILSCYKFLDEERILRFEKMKSNLKETDEIESKEKSNDQENAEKENIEQSNKYSRRELANVNIILCHLVAESGNKVKLRLSHCGSDVKIRLVKVSPAANNDTKNQQETTTSSSENHSSNSSLNLIPGQEANYSGSSQREVDLFEAHSFTITDPICQEVTLTNDQEILFLGINFMLNEDRQLSKILQGTGFSLHDKLKRYTELESSARNTDDVISLAVQLSSHQTSESSMEFTEKYKSWECIVTQNQNFKFNRRLIAMPLTKNLSDIKNYSDNKDLTCSS